MGGSNLEKKKMIFVSLNKKLFFMIILSTVVFFAVQIYFTSILGTSNAAIEEIRIEKDNLRLENEILSSKVDEVNSTKNIQALIEKYNLQQKPINEIEKINELAIEY